MTRTGDREIRSVSGRLPDNPGELACMHMYLCVLEKMTTLRACTCLEHKCKIFLSLSRHIEKQLGKRSKKTSCSLAF